MLIKICTHGGDYERTLRLRRTLGMALLLVGLVGVICDRLLVQGSSLPDFAQGFYQGAATGILIAALAVCGRAQYLLTHPEARKKARIKETDEREQSISRTAFYFAGMFTFFVAAAALFILLPINMGAFFALLAVIVVYFLAWVCSSLWLSRRR